MVHISFALEPWCESIRSLFFFVLLLLFTVSMCERMVFSRLHFSPHWQNNERAAKITCFYPSISMHSTLGRNQSFHSYCIYHMFPIIEKCCSDSATDSALFANITLPLALASAVLHSHFVLSICCSIYTRRNLLLRVLFNGKWDCCGKCMPLVAKHLTHFHSSHCCYTVSLYNKWKCLLLLIVYTQIVLWHFGFRRKFTERNRFPPIFERSNGNALEIRDKKNHFKHVMSHCKACIICQVLKTHANVHGWYFFPKQCEKKVFNFKFKEPFALIQWSMLAVQWNVCVC